MTNTLFVLIKCDLGANAVAASILDDIDNVTEIYATGGDYDLIAKFKLDRDADVDRFVTDRVGGLDGVRETFAIPAFSPFI